MRGTPSFVGNNHCPESIISFAAPAYWPSVSLYRSPQPAVPKWSRAANPIGETNNACRSGGGLIAGDSSKASSRPRVLVPATIVLSDLFAVALAPRFGRVAAVLVPGIR